MRNHYEDNRNLAGADCLPEDGLVDLDDSEDWQELESCSLDDIDDLIHLGPATAEREPGWDLLFR